jgi:hypothetical protein
MRTNNSGPLIHQEKMGGHSRERTQASELWWLIQGLSSALRFYFKLDWSPKQTKEKLLII